ncbi:MAG: hypothetical protein HYU66_27465 [Armatimonadetes bacterium]|nr:hypothetical protein [Armatimonadota bacterium]
MLEAEIICVARSHMNLGWCVAGLRTDGEGWIRPVNEDMEEPLRPDQIRLGPGRLPYVGDVCRVPLLRPLQQPYQPENWLVGRQPWRLVRAWTAEDIALCIECIESGPNLLDSPGDSVPAAAVWGQAVRASLAIVAPKDAECYVRERDGRPRMLFALEGVDYDLAVTDPV